MARLNKKHLFEVGQILSSAMNFHMTYHMQDDQDLEPGFRRREYQRRVRWRKAIEYYNKVILKKARGDS